MKMLKALALALLVSATTATVNVVANDHNKRPSDEERVELRKNRKSKAEKRAAKKEKKKNHKKNRKGKSHKNEKENDNRKMRE